MNELSVGIHQPNFIPWLGYFHKISLVDVFVLFDDVQVPQGKSFATRALFKTHQGPLWISIPAMNKSDKADFNNITILNSNWKNKALKTIKLSYQKAPYFNTYFEPFAKIFESPAETLFDYNYGLLLFLKESFGLKAEFKISSQLPVDPALTGADKIVAILECLSATSYVSGTGSGSRRYINEEDFKARNIKLVWQEYKPIEYHQLHGPFIPNLCALDYLFNCGPDVFSGR